MFEALAHVPPAHIAYLATVIAAFTAFGAALSFAHLWSNLPVTRRPR